MKAKASAPVMKAMKAMRAATTTVMQTKPAAPAMKAMKAMKDAKAMPPMNADGGMMMKRGEKVPECAKLVLIFQMSSSLRLIEPIRRNTFLLQHL